MYVITTFVICLLCLVLITMHLQLDVCNHNFCTWPSGFPIQTILLLLSVKKKKKDRIIFSEPNRGNTIKRTCDVLRNYKCKNLQ